MSQYVDALQSDVLARWREKSQNVIYQTDPEAWLWDVLKRRWWSTQREIAWSFALNKYTIVKSCNNVGKTQLAGDLVTWFISVHPPQETIAMVSAPVRNQIDENMFRYLRENYNIAKDLGHPLQGEITRWPKWVTHDPYDIDLVLPKRPADQNLVSAFQGVHKDHVAVVLDEAGGLQEDFYTGASAVTNNKHAAILAIGNPDDKDTPFHQRFKDREKYVDWTTFSIAAKDTPNFTGEKIYPEDPELDEKIKGRLIQVDWVAMMRRSAAEGVVKAKVDAEFPDENDNSFFSQSTINKGWATFGLIEEIGISDDAYRTLGVDVAFTGMDKNVVYLNNGGKITKIDQWDKGTEGEASVEDGAIARRIHRLALEHAVHEVRLDAAGTSRGVHSFLKSEIEFVDRPYILIGVVGSKASPDIRKWYNARAWHFDDFRRRLKLGEFGIDPKDTDLKTDMEVMTSKYTIKSQLLISTKADIKKELKHSPDHLDAVIYSAIDFSGLTHGPAAGLQKGDTVTVDPWAAAELDHLAGMPVG